MTVRFDSDVRWCIDSENDKTGGFAKLLSKPWLKRYFYYIPDGKGNITISCTNVFGLNWVCREPFRGREILELISNKKEVGGNYKDKFISLMRKTLDYHKQIENIISKEECTRKDVREVDALIKKMSVKELTATNSKKQTFLHLLSIYDMTRHEGTGGHAEILNKIIAAVPAEKLQGFLDIRDKYNNSALDYAVQGEGYVATRITEKMDKEALKKFVLGKTRANGMTIFHTLAAKGECYFGQYGDTVAMCISALPEKERADFITKVDVHGNTALHYTGIRDLNGVYRALIAGVPENKREQFINMKNRKGQTARESYNERFEAACARRRCCGSSALWNVLHGYTFW